MGFMQVYSRLLAALLCVLPKVLMRRWLDAGQLPGLQELSRIIHSPNVSVEAVMLSGAGEQGAPG